MKNWKTALSKGGYDMTPADEIVEIVESTIGDEIGDTVTYRINSFPELKLMRLTNLYSVRLLASFQGDKIYVERFESLKEDFANRKIEFRNLITERTQSIVLSGCGEVIINSPVYYDCVFTDQEDDRGFICQNCVFHKELEE